MTFILSSHRRYFSEKIGTNYVIPLVFSTAEELITDNEIRLVNIERLRQVFLVILVSFVGRKLICFAHTMVISLISLLLAWYQQYHSILIEIMCIDCAMFNRRNKHFLPSLMHNIRSCSNLANPAIDPLGQPKVMAGMDHCFRTCCPYVRTSFSTSVPTFQT